MEREKTKRWLERQLISDPGSVEDKRSVCVDRGEREDGGERRKSMCLTHILPRPFILFHRVRSVSNQKAGAPFGSARPFFLFFFFPFLFSFFLLPLPPPPRSSSTIRPPLCTGAPTKERGARARARARQDKRDDRAGRHPVNLDNEQDPTGVRSLLENGLITVLALRN